MIFPIHFSYFFPTLFTDETSVFLSGKEYTHLIVLIKRKNTKKVSRWLSANGLTINVKQDSLYKYECCIRDCYACKIVNG